MNICSVNNCDRKAIARGFCKKHWTRWRRSNNTNVKTYHEKSSKERFFEKVDKKGLNDCWLWLGHTRGNSKMRYGKFDIHGKVYSAHRYSYILEYGEIPSVNDSDYRGSCVLHKCDNPLCVNPNHLFVGSHDDNMKDKVSKGRGTGFITHCKRGHEFTSENTYISKRGFRHCRTCHRDKERNRRLKLKNGEN